MEALTEFRILSAGKERGGEQAQEVLLYMRILNRRLTQPAGKKRGSASAHAFLFHKTACWILCWASAAVNMAANLRNAVSSVDCRKKRRRYVKEKTFAHIHKWKSPGCLLQGERGKQGPGTRLDRVHEKPP